MKIIFLDVDGVLNTPNIRRNDMYALGHNQLLLLKAIIDRTNCQIVLSSTWRLYNEARKALLRTFQHYGIPKWIDVTKSLDGPRSEEIKLYLSSIDTYKAVGIDDDPDIIFEEVNYKPFITDTKIGLTPKIADSVIGWLNG